MDARVRFIPKKVGDTWRVYDTFMGSFPGQRKVLGVVAQDVATEAEAQAEADRCNEAQRATGSMGSKARETKQYKDEVD